MIRNFKQNSISANLEGNAFIPQLKKITVENLMTGEKSETCLISFKNTSKLLADIVKMEKPRKRRQPRQVLLETSHGTLCRYKKHVGWYLRMPSTTQEPGEFMMDNTLPAALWLDFEKEFNEEKKRKEENDEHDNHDN